LRGGICRWQSVGGNVTNVGHTKQLHGSQRGIAQECFSTDSKAHIMEGRDYSVGTLVGLAGLLAVTAIGIASSLLLGW
jgi:hypothetical protein